MKLINQNFTEVQFKSIYELLEGINNTNNDIRSNSKIDGIQMFKDKYNNFYISYCYTYPMSDGIVTSLQYYMIDSLGNKSDLSLQYPNKADIAIRLSNYDIITLA